LDIETVGNLVAMWVEMMVELMVENLDELLAAG
jgi:hypothetical protein